MVFVVFLFFWDTFSDNPSQRLLCSMVPQILIVLMKFKITYYILYFTRDSQITTFFVLHIPDFCFFYNKGIKKKKKHLKNSTSDYLKGFCFVFCVFVFCFVFYISIGVLEAINLQLLVLGLNSLEGIQIHMISKERLTFKESAIKLEI